MGKTSHKRKRKQGYHKNGIQRTLRIFSRQQYGIGGT
jgi:hypothetical protein